MSTAWHAYLWTSAAIVVLCGLLTRSAVGALGGVLVSALLAIPWFIFALVFSTPGCDWATSGPC